MRIDAIVIGLLFVAVLFTGDRSPPPVYAGKQQESSLYVRSEQVSIDDTLSGILRWILSN
jgi:hypothetical protein